MTTQTAVAVNHRIDGPAEGPAVVLSNSLGTSPAMWDGQVPALAGRLRVVRYDHRGHGGSPVPPGPYSVADLGRDLLTLLDRLGLERVSLCGLSLGGMVSMWVASEAPDRIDRLALCCTSALLGPRGMWAERAALVREQGMDAVVDGAAERWFTPAFRAEHPERVEPVREQLRATPPEGYAACCEAIGGMDLRGRLGSISAPTLVIAADEDPSTPPEHGRRIADAIPGARLEVIAGAAHLANIGRPEEFNRALLAHLGGGA